MGDPLAGAVALLGQHNLPFSTGFQSSPGTLLGYSIATADFNGDGTPDLAIAGANFAPVNGKFKPCGEDFVIPCWPSVQVLLGTGTGSFAVGSTTAISSQLSAIVAGTATVPPANDLPYALVSGDFNGDGKIDLAVTNGAANSVVILLAKATARSLWALACRWAQARLASWRETSITMGNWTWQLPTPSTTP